MESRKRKQKKKTEKSENTKIVDYSNAEFQVTPTTVTVKFLDTVTTLNYPKIEVHELLKNNEAHVVKCKEGDELHRLGIADKVGYVQVAAQHDNMQMQHAVYCENIVACFHCLETFYYHFDERLVMSVKTHKCGIPQQSIIYVKHNSTEPKQSFSLINEEKLPVINPLDLPKILSKIDVSTELPMSKYNLSTHFTKYYKNNLFTDLTVVCDSQCVECHRVVLCAYSAYFEEVVDENHSQGRSLVHIKDLQFWQVKALIDFMYTCKLEAEEDKYEKLSEAIDVLRFRKCLIPIQLICYRLRKTQASC